MRRLLKINLHVDVFHEPIRYDKVTFDLIFIV